MQDDRNDLENVKPFQTVLNFAHLKEGSNCTEVSLRMSEQNLLGELKLLQNKRSL